MVENPILVSSANSTVNETYTNAYVAVQLMDYIDVYTRGEWLKMENVKTGTGTTQALFAIDAAGDYMTFAEAQTVYGEDAPNVKKATYGFATDAISGIELPATIAITRK